MPIAYMDETGFKVAKPGFNARTTGEQNLLFSSSASSLTLYATGVVARASGTTLGPDGDRYHYATISFGKTFSQPPICFFAGRMPDGKWNTSIGCYNPGSGFFYANLWGLVTTTNLTLYAYVEYGVTQFRYYVMENTIQ